MTDSPHDHPWEDALDGDLSPEAREHLAACDSCREHVRRVQGAATVLLAGIPQPPPGLDVRVLARVEEERQAAGRRRQRRAIHIPLPHLRLPVRPLALGLAAAAVAVVALVLVRPSTLSSDNAQGVGIVPLRCGHSEQLVVAGVWSGNEASNFAKVLGRFQERTGIQVVYAYQTRSIATKLEALVKRGCAPDVAMLPQPGTMGDLARRGALQPLGPVVGDVLARNYSPAWRQLGSVDGTLYGVWFKAAAKSMIWYRADAFRKAGIQRPPRTWDELLADARRLRAVGIQPFAIAGADGWTLTDWFSNVYLATAGPVRYQALAEHRIKWTDPTVVRALHDLAEVFGDRAFSGPLARSSKTSFEQSVAQVFGPHPRAAMVFEGDFVRSFLPAKLARAGAPFFTFPTPTREDAAPVAVGGDVAVLFSKDARARRLIRFLASPAAAELWAGAGGFISPNRSVKPDAYPDALTRRLAAGIAKAPTVRFGLSDQEPPAFGSDPYQGMWLMFQRFLARPNQIAALTRQLEAGATAALECERAVGGDC